MSKFQPKTAREHVARAHRLDAIPEYVRRVFLHYTRMPRSPRRINVVPYSAARARLEMRRIEAKS